MPYKIHSMQLDRDAESGTPVNIPDIENETLTNNPNIERIISAGETQPKHASLISQSATGSFTTFGIQQCIDALTIKPTSIVSDTQDGVRFFMEQFDEYGLTKAGSVDRALLISAGVMVPRRITCDHQGHARMMVDVVVIKETANAAVVISDVDATPTLTNQGYRWTLAGIQVGAVALSDYTNVDIDLGNTVTTRGTQSDVWDVYVEVRTHAPSITVTGIDPAWFKASGGVPIDGLACTQANSHLYLRKRATDGTGFIADGTSEHIKLTFAGVATIQQPLRGDMQRITDTSLIINCIEDGSQNDPIIVDTASAIT